MLRLLTICLIAVFTKLSLSAQELPPDAFEGVSQNAEWTPLIQKFDGVDMVLVPAGCFLMGDDAALVDQRRQEAQATWPDVTGDFKALVTAFTEISAHEICFEQPFWIDRTEVTQEQFARLDGQKASENAFTGEAHPVENITWFEARDFCMQRDGRLPTEAEWEYAARGPANLRFPWGNEWNSALAVAGREVGVGSAPVGSLPDNASWVGALDMSGNVWEWTASVLAPYPYDAEDGRENNTEDVSNVFRRVLRGGSWSNINEHVFTTSFREWHFPTYPQIIYGFRCVRNIAVP